MVAPGNGAFTPAFDTNGNAVLIPVSIGPFTGVIRDADDNIVGTFTEQRETKGQAGKRLKNAVTCTFSLNFVSDRSEPDFPPGFSVTATGTVVVKVTPGR